MTLRLDESHAYWLGEEPLLGCTDTLKGVGLVDTAHYNDEAMLRGTWVHDEIEQRLVKNTICACSVCAEDRECDPRGGYVRAAFKFLTDHDVEVLHVEHILCDPLRKIAGKVDLIGMLPAPITRTPRYAIIDWKTGQPEPWHGYQFAVYEHLARCNGLVEGLCDRIGVYLRADGTYTTKRYTDRKDWKVAEAAFLVQQAKGV